MIVDILVEGPADELVAVRIIRYCGLEAGTVYGKRGAGSLRKQIGGFNERARFGRQPMLALVDFMDTRLSCPAEVPTTWLPDRAPNLLLRVVVPELESWLLADSDGLGRFLRVRPALLPAQPETIADPKQAIVNLARASRSSRIRDALVPRPGFSASVGPGYLTLLHTFVESYWDVDRARSRSDSLDRCLRRLDSLKTG